MTAIAVPTPATQCTDPASLTAAMAVDLEGEGADTTHVRQRVVAALNAMLDQVQRRDLHAQATENGISVLLEHDNVRCVLVVSPQMPRHALSPRELQRARLVAVGATNRAIASRLEISLWTVSTHMRRIFTTMGVRSRAEMVAQFFGGAEHQSARPLPPH